MTTATTTERVRGLGPEACRLPPAASGVTTPSTDAAWPPHTSHRRADAQIGQPTLPNDARMWYNGRMRVAEVEPGFLPAYRLFVAARILFWAAIGPILLVMQVAAEGSPAPARILSTEVVQNMSPPNASWMIAAELGLLLLLMLPQAPRLLGHWFVPTTLVIGLVPLLIGYYWWPSENPLQTPFVIFFFVMLVLIAWQYPFRYVLAYILGLSLYQAYLSSSVTDMPLTVDVGLLVLQAAMMLIIGYITATLVSVQRAQRRALARAYEQQSAANESLQLYAATLEELTISRERNRLARELHDTLAHSLSAVAVQLPSVGRMRQCLSVRIPMPLRQL
jgi:hypothetical protein